MYEQFGDSVKIAEANPKAVSELKEASRRPESRIEIL